MTQSKPPTPRRCQRILQAHRLRCQGLSLSEIARAMNCARSTVCAYLRDLKLHYRHILQSVAADQLLNLIPALTEPDQEPAQHRQQIATVRELRLLLTAMSRIETAQPEPAVPEPKPVPTYNPNEMSVTRFYAEHPEPELDAQTESELQPPTPFGPDPDPIEPDLDKSGLPEPDSPATAAICDPHFREERSRRPFPLSPRERGEMPRRGRGGSHRRPEATQTASPNS